MATKEAARQYAKGKVICMAPDVCLTPMGNAVVPVPYPIMIKMKGASAIKPKVNFKGYPAFTEASDTTEVKGDAAGTKKGVSSGKVENKSVATGMSSTVRVCGEWVIRHGDDFDMNCS